MPFLDSLIVLVCIVAMRASKTVHALIIYSTVAASFLYLFGSDLDRAVPQDIMGAFGAWPARGYIWRTIMLFGLVLSILIRHHSYTKDDDKHERKYFRAGN